MADFAGSQTDFAGSQTDFAGSQTDFAGSQTDFAGSQIVKDGCPGETLGQPSCYFKWETRGMDKIQDEPINLPFL